jgi:hypothetical protein
MLFGFSVVAFVVYTIIIWYQFVAPKSSHSFQLGFHSFQNLKTIDPLTQKCFRFTISEYRERLYTEIVNRKKEIRRKLREKERAERELQSRSQQRSKVRPSGSAASVT